MKLLNNVSNATKTVAASATTTAIAGSAAKTFSEGCHKILPYMVKETSKKHFWSKKQEIIKCMNPLTGKECGNMVTSIIIKLNKEVF